MSSILVGLSDFWRHAHFRPVPKIAMRQTKLFRFRGFVSEGLSDTDESMGAFLTSRNYLAQLSLVVASDEQALLPVADHSAYYLKLLLPHHFVRSPARLKHRH